MLLITKNMRAFGLIFVAASLMPAQTVSQQRGKKIVDNAIAALGGDNFLHMRNRIETGRAYSFYRERLTGLSIARIYTRYDDSAEGLKVRERQTFGKKEDAIVLFTADNGYQLTYRGAKPLPKDRLTRYRESTHRNILYILRERLHEPGLIFEAQGADVFDNQPVDVVDVIDNDNKTVKVMFNQETHLPVRQSYSHLDPETKERDEEVTLFTKYRDVGGGVHWPFNILRERNGEKLFEIFSETVVINHDLADSMFSLPAGMKLLD
jgi:hypothetical protein